MPPFLRWLSSVSQQRREVEGDALMRQSLYHSALGQDVMYEVAQVPEGGDAQTEAVVAMMSRYATEDATSAEIRRDVQTLMAERVPGDEPVDAVFWWVKRHLAFVRDEQTAIPFQSMAGPGSVVVETLVRPRDMSVMIGGSPQGDCDDFSMYTAALLINLGIGASFVTVAADPGSDDYSHIYVAAYPGGRRVAMDTSHGTAPGWETKKGKRVREWPVGGGGGLMSGGVSTLAILAIGAWLLCRW